MRSVRCNLLRCSQLRHNSTKSDWRNAVHTKNASVNALVYADPNSKPGRHGPLQDLAIAIKDNICTSSMPTTCSSAMLKGSYTFVTFLLVTSRIVFRFHFAVQCNSG